MIISKRENPAFHILSNGAVSVRRMKKFKITFVFCVQISRELGGTLGAGSTLIYPCLDVSGMFSIIVSSKTLIFPLKNLQFFEIFYHQLSCGLLGLRGEIKFLRIGNNYGQSVGS